MIFMLENHALVFLLLLPNVIDLQPSQQQQKSACELTKILQHVPHKGFESCIIRHTLCSNIMSQLSLAKHEHVCFLNNLP